MSEPALTQEQAKAAYQKYQDEDGFLRQKNIANFITTEQNLYVLQVWENMPGHTCYFDAFMRIVKGQA